MLYRTTVVFFFLMCLLFGTIHCVASINDENVDPKTTTTTTTEATTTTTTSEKESNTNTQHANTNVRLVTPEDLATKNGEDGGTELWLSILGKVYDVSTGKMYYAPGSGYHIFAGRDATIPFITGNFTDEEAQKSTEELTPAQLYSIERDWAQFYANHERYKLVGYLVGRYYDEQGNPTEELLRVQERVKGYEVIKEQKDKERREKRKKMGMMGGGMIKMQASQKAQTAGDKGEL